MTACRRVESTSLGWLTPIAIGSGIALAAIAVANSVARSHSTSWTGPLFWVAIVALIAPTGMRLLTPNAATPERIGLVTWLVVALYLVKVMYEPTQFALHDELVQLRTTHDIAATGHLYNVNPIVRVYPYFPGLNLATAALAKICHLSMFTAGTLIVGIARVVGGLGLYLLLCRLTKSERLAGIGLLAYASNPNFLYFDAQYGYESLALQLAIVVLLAVDLAVADRDASRWPPRVFASVLIFAIVVTHHLTSYWLAVILVGWSVVLLLLRRRNPGLRVTPGVPAWPGLVALAATLAWQFGVVRGAVTPELDPIRTGIRSLIDFVSGNASSGKKLFQSGTGQGGEATWAQMIGFASVGMVLIVIAVGLLRMLRGHRWRHPLTVLLALTAGLLPVTLALRFTQAGTETSSRASEFLYVGVAVLAGAAATYLPGMPDHTRRRARESSVRGSPATTRVVALGATAYLTVMFVGGFVVGWAPYQRQPGPYLAAADIRSVGPQGVAAARWADRHIPPDTFIAADEVNGLLMAAYAELNPQTGSYDGVPISTIFYARSIGPTEHAVISGDKIAYVVVDRRISRYKPYAKGYFNGSAPVGVNPALPLPNASLAKFDSAEGFVCVYDSGPIAIYSTGLR